jgi:hypothetical protein
MSTVVDGNEGAYDNKRAWGSVGVVQKPPGLAAMTSNILSAAILDSFGIVGYGDVGVICFECL